jgi:hypothetical protein
VDFGRIAGQGVNGHPVREVVARCAYSRLRLSEVLGRVYASLALAFLDSLKVLAPAVCLSHSQGG